MRVFLLLALLLYAMPLHAAQNPPSLVDRLMQVLGDKSVLPPIEIRPAPGTPAATASSAPQRNARGGLEIATHFLPVYDLDSGMGSEDGSVPAPTPSVLPFFASSEVGRPQRNIYSLIIMIPDSDRDAARAYAFARSAQDNASALKPDWYAANALVFAPQFLSPEDVSQNAASWPDAGKSVLNWAGAGWIYGGDSVSNSVPSAPAPRGMSSYQVMDFILLALARKQVFPDLERVVIAGAGAGGDFVQRYAALGVAPDIVSADGIAVRFVAANAWSYLYFDKTRAVPNEVGVYTVETDSVFAEPKAESCASYNMYPYGLEALPPYGKRQGETAIRLRYDSRNVVYLTGKEAKQTLPDASPQACALILQGRSLNARTQLFFQHLNRLYGENLARLQRMYAVEKVGAEIPALWSSRCGLSVLYGDAACESGSLPAPMTATPMLPVATPEPARAPEPAPAIRQPPAPAAPALPNLY